MKETDPLLPQDASSLTPSAQEGRGSVFEVLYWSIVVINVLAALLFLVGQTMALFNYDWTVSIGQQEPPDQIGPVMVQVIRGFCVADTIINIPLLLSSALGLALKKQVSLICTAAVGGITFYWSVAFVFIYWFEQIQHVPEWTYTIPLCRIGSFCGSLLCTESLF